MTQFGALIEMVFETEEIAEGDSCYRLDEIIKEIKKIHNVVNVAVCEGPDELMNDESMKNESL